MKFAHIADTHIKNLKYHFEYRAVFDRLYETLREEKVDYIIHCGDIAHTKTQISPEFVELCSDFFRNLEAIAPTYIILGNHDGNLKNKSRQDALTPIVEALNLPNLFLLKNSGEVNLDDFFTLNVLSVFDRDSWVAPTNSERVNIALYHGSISGCETDLGWKMDHGENDMSIFKGHDFAFLGDIHKTNQALDLKGRIRYCGSTVQQNHGETNDKGFLIWDIKDKDDWNVEHFILKNPKPFVTLELTPTGRIPTKADVETGARLRLVSNNNLPIDKMKKAVEVAKHRFSPESITFLNRASGQRGNVEELTEDLEKDNLRDPVIQEELIEEYLKDYNPDDDLIKKVFRLNSKYNVAIEETEEVNRNVNWRLEQIEWDNLFNYGPENVINFNKLAGIVGIFGKNFSGKSSIIDSILFTLFNSTSKNERKNLNVINQNKEEGGGRVTISIGEKKYTVDRRAEKYIKRLKGDETLEAKTDVNFECYDAVMEETESLNGLSRNQTDKHIRKHFGAVEDFLLTSMSSQLGALQFIGEGSTRRKEILAKFLDLEVFDKKYKLAKDDASDLRGALKRLEGKEFDSDITEAYTNLLLNEKETEKHSQSCEELKEEIDLHRHKADEIQKKIDLIPAEVINIEAVEKSISSNEGIITDKIEQTIQLGDKVGENKELLEKIETFLEGFDAADLQERKETAEEQQNKLDQIINEIKTKELEIQNQEKKAELLKEVPCGSEYSHCKFIKDAYVAVDNLSITNKECSVLENNKTATIQEIDNLNVGKIEEHLAKYQQLLTRRNQIENDISTDQLLVDKTNIEIKSLEKELEGLKEKSEEYHSNREVIENKETFIKEFEEEKSIYIEKERELEKCQRKLLEFYKEHGSLEQKLKSLEDQKQELANLREEFSAYDLYMRCMHPNGIAYDIIKRKLPVINEEIAKVLANIVEFEAFFEADDKHLRVFIKHPKHEPRPIEMGSGAEKTIVSMAIRLALLSVSSLPKSDIFILDEPGTALDAENMDGFVSILEIVKSYFKTVLLISHLDSLKDCVDMEITINKQDGYAHVAET